MKLPRALATTAARGSGLVRADVGAVTATGDAGFGAIAKLGGDIRSVGGDIAAIQRHKQKISDDTQTDRIGQNIRLWAGAQEEALKTTRIETPQDQEKYLAGLTKGYNEMVGLELKGMSSGVQRNVKSASSRHFPAVHDQARRTSSAKFMEYTTTTELGIANAEAAAGDVVAADKRVDDLEAKGIIGPKRAAAAKADNVEVLKESAIENIKPLLINTSRNLGKEKALDLLRANVNDLIKQGVLTSAEGAEADKILGDWLDNFVAGRDKKAKDAIKLTTIESYKDLSEPIVKGQLTFQDIDDSSMLKADKELWREYIKGSYKDPPKNNTPVGFNVAFNAVYDAATLQLSPKEAYDVLLEARFNKQSITNEQYEWGVDKINNPYPKDTMEDINLTVKSNLEDFNRATKFDNDRNKKVNESLIAWVDSQTAKGKTPTKKEMYAMSSQFRVGDDRWYDIGQVIERGGRKWEVIGFDEDGEPLVEEAR
jgi:hypothetical protein